MEAVGQKWTNAIYWKCAMPPVTGTRSDCDEVGHLTP